MIATVLCMTSVASIPLGLGRMPGPSRVCIRGTLRTGHCRDAVFSLYGWDQRSQTTAAQLTIAITEMGWQRKISWCPTDTLILCRALSETDAQPLFACALNLMFGVRRVSRELPCDCAGHFILNPSKEA
jgi:hypothetical protein